MGVGKGSVRPERGEVFLARWLPLLCPLASAAWTDLHIYLLASSGSLRLVLVDADPGRGREENAVRPCRPPPNCVGRGPGGSTHSISTVQPPNENSPSEIGGIPERPGTMGPTLNRIAGRLSQGAAPLGAGD